MIDELFEAMAREEGFFAGGKIQNRPQRNNNPLNLNFAGQEGATIEPCPICNGGINRTHCQSCNGTGNGRFAKFTTPGAGKAAAMRQLLKWIQQGKTLEQLINTHAPSNENNTARYVSNVASRLHTAGIQVDPVSTVLLTIL